MCTFPLLDSLLRSTRVALRPCPRLLFLQTFYLKSIRIYPPPPAIMGRATYATSNIRPKHQLLTSPHPVPELTNRYSILTVYDANDDPTDVSPKQGIIAGPYMNEDQESDKALLTDDLHAEVALRPATRPAKRPASSSSQVKASNEKATTISPVILTTEMTSGRPLRRCEPSMVHARSDDAKPHARSLQSSVAEGRADFEKGGPQARSVTPPRSHLQRTVEMALTERPNALEDKAWDPERVHLWTTPVPTGDDTTDADPHAASAPCISDPGGDHTPLVMLGHNRFPCTHCLYSPEV